MKVLVTGGTGFIGSHLVEHLIDQGADVTCCIRRTSNLRWLDQKNVKLIYADLISPDTLVKISEIPFDYIYHIAGLVTGSSRERFFDVNAKGTENLLFSILNGKGRPKRIVVISSIAVCGQAKCSHPVDETDPPNPVGFYGESKLSMERIVGKFSEKLPITIIRPPAVYGPRDEMTLQIFRLIKYRIMPMIGGFDRELSLIYVEDLVRGVTCASLSEASIGKTYYLTDQKVFNYRDVTQAIENSLGVRALRITLPIPVAYIVAFISETIFRSEIVTREKIAHLAVPAWTCSPESAAKDFGFETKIGLEEGIRMTVDWYREMGWL
jgi:dihydroflavonol-4-reductase